MSFEYRIINISTEKGIREAERLKRLGESELPEGYPMTTIGIDKVQFSIPKTQSPIIGNSSLKYVK